MCRYFNLSLLLLGPLFFASGRTEADRHPWNSAVQWNNAALQGIRDAKLGVPIAAIAARALAIVHTCMYDAWSVYDERAIGTQLAGALRRPASERTLANKERAISYAAYRALVDVLPGDTESVYKPLMKQLGYDPNDNSTDIETPTGIGNVACAAVLEFRHHDKSNQLGDLAQGPYSDWTHFRPVNMPSPVPMRLPAIHPIDASHWLPLTYVEVAVRNIARRLRDDISEEKPVLDSRLPDGSRVAAVVPPCSLHGVTLTIRKFNAKHFGIEDLIAIGTITQELAGILETAVIKRQNILISGGTGTGKTTLLNILATLIPEHERHSHHRGHSRNSD